MVLNFVWFHSSIIPWSTPGYYVYCDAWFMILPVKKYQQAVSLWLTKKIVHSDRFFIVVELVC